MESINIGSRISLRGIGVGVLASFALRAVLLRLEVVLGIVSFGNRVGQTPLISNWVWTAIAWIVSVGAGAYLASVVGRVHTIRDGMLTGLVTWAAALVARWIALVYLFPRPTGAFRGDFSLNLIQFCGLVVGLLFALYFGGRGALREAKMEVAEEEQEARTRGLKPAFQP